MFGKKPVENSILLEVSETGLIVIDQHTTLDEGIKVNFKTPNHDGVELTMLLESLRKGDQIKIVYLKNQLSNDPTKKETQP